MISTLHLLWIIPLAALFGAFGVALCHAGSSSNDISQEDHEA